MYKLQVVLVPPSLQATTPIQFGYGPTIAESSQLLPNRTSIAQSAGDASLQYANLRSANASFSPNYFNQPRYKKFLLFTKPTSTLLNLSDEIIDKCEKMYPSLQEDIEILSLQDNSGCDLDPDFLIKDVFNVNNVVRVILKNEIDLDDTAPVSLYRSVKRSKLNNGSPHSVQLQQQIPASSGVLRIAKKRPPTATTATTSTTIRSAINGSMRISTPLARQIYPPPSSKIMSNNSDDEDEDVGERSFLPPPTQPQSPPIRISSGIDAGKKIKSSIVEEDIVSRSETVDPDKSKQQRLLSGTPIMSTMTPNRVTLTGQRVVSEHAQKNELVFSASASSSSSFANAGAAALTVQDSNRKPSVTTPRITSGMLRIPEPRISEIEKELKEGPSSPASVLPAKGAKIPMKKPYLENGENYESDESSSSENQETPETEPHSKASLQRSQSSIADNNGSPVKNSPLGDVMPHNVHLAELPKAGGTAITKFSHGASSKKQQGHQPPRKSSLETIVEKKSQTEPSATVEPRRMTNFSDGRQGRENGNSNDKLSQKENLPTIAHSIQPILASSNKPTGKENPLGSKVNVNGHTPKEADAIVSDAVEDDDDNDEADTTVRIVPQDSDSSSFPKSELFKMIEGDGTDLPQWFKGKNSRRIFGSGNSKNSKPYTTVLNKDIDNSKPDPRNILPQRTARSAAKRAAQLLAGAKKNETPGKVPEDSSSAGSTDNESESGIETDVSSEDDLKKKKNLPLPNDGPKNISLHSLKGSVVPLTDAKVNNSKEAVEETNNRRPSVKTPQNKIEPAPKTSEISVTHIKISEQMAKSFYPNSNKKQNERTKPQTQDAPQAISSAVSNTPPAATKASAPSTEKVNNKTVEPKTKNVAIQPDNQSKEISPKTTESKSANTDGVKDSGSKVEKKADESKAAERTTATTFGAGDSNTLKEGTALKGKLLNQNKVNIVSNLKEGRPKPAKPSANDKLKDLKAKFTNSKTFVPPGILSNEKNDSSLSNDDSESSGSSTEDESSSSSSSSDGETSTSRKARRVVVNTPREPVRSSSSKIEVHPSSLNQTNHATPNKVPVTQLMDMSSPPSVRSKTPSNPSSILHDLPRKVRPSLSSLSDLVSRGIPDVKEKTSRSTGKSQPKATSSSEDEASPGAGSDSSSDSVSDSSSSSSGSDLDSDDSGDSSDDGKSFISAKSASAALGKKKKPSGGFASLIKDFKKK
ncbi:Net1p [Saccharomyces cerevisiae x Saccharomyces kudriavzevii VIN7]|uniref:Net1p n=1 Tax=Saccharomyces cerevisiae x Saccharomyces kudriavzevii (strain VIN7) TaxID=1095631 RepID=H0GWS5_SACCK|nr:Net1p [Saccharomyces cerevisiae x Saccharomyces kudriavzevii VIN7]